MEIPISGCGKSIYTHRDASDYRSKNRKMRSATSVANGAFAPHSRGPGGPRAPPLVGSRAMPWWGSKGPPKPEGIYSYESFGGLTKGRFKRL